MTSSRRIALPPRTLVAALALGLAGTATAGVSYRLDRPSAAPGDTVTIEAVYFNEGNARATWEAPPELVLQWRGQDGQIVRSLAKLQGGKASYSVPVNNFARMAWSAEVPASARGLQAISIEGQPAMMALDATGRDSGTLASTPAPVPVVDPRTGQPVPPAVVTAAGASPEGGPAPDTVAVSSYQQSAFDHFRSAISEYKPVYFDIGTRGQTTARFQISAKYRLFSPSGNRPATWGENFYLGYTQTSLWDLQGDSMPFIDTTFNPSLFWLSDNMWQSESQSWRLGLNTGVEHNSNGKAGDDSRSVNDAYIQPQFNYRFDGGSTLTFAPKVKAYFGVASENSDYADYAGRVDWNLRWAQDNGAVVSAMYRQGDQRRRTTQLDFAWPLQRTWLNMNGYLHLQYFNGYGETLLGYNQRNESQFRIGLSLVP
ncbi:phospholipase A [Achromobacter xylosoxidans]|jgi:outer membrane phospholipase A|uniref:Phospholipase A1 n=2 Tax=Alcaligenes xylosoxydans xylosoxydans TaxID=85698 RepID=A0A0D6ICZ9_ALCXX|nr:MULTISPECIES: phospholipase A [Achromobacter]AHC49031.1 Phospholipase A1 precursor [Achromobacter xylosoxidans NBRC 15126 = ATCC 27061]AXA79018.1 phospholipase A [Achromobacter xylosoxidans]KAA5926434.1 phospholipase [Achromobacter xylosoxidans]KOQ19258.1 phospholipase [Achromobacter xylosoxidans]KOQ24432.1 phospholipase [Achromobacter xylosoxidans]